MASTTKHLRSSTASKRPTASGLAEGQLAINTASGTPGLFLKDSAGTVVKVGPVHVGTSAPNATPAGSAGNSTGELWVDNSATIHGLNYYTGSAFVNLTPSGTATVAGLVELATDAETQTGTDTVRAVTPSGLQSKVSDSTSTTSSTTIASSTAVKAAYDLANAALPKAGGVVTGALEIGTAGSLVFEGSSADSFETTLAVVNPTADRTITLPNVTGTVITTGDTGTVTSTMIADDTIVNADINASAAIALSKLATGALPSSITVASANIVNSTIVNDDISATAGIVDTKLATISTAGKVSDSALPDTISSNITGNAATVSNGVYTNSNATITAQHTYQANNTVIANADGGLTRLEVIGTGGAAFMQFHRPSAFAAYFGLDSDNQFKIGGWSFGAASYPILHTGNFNTYVPTLAGVGATGTWGINVTGNAATVTTNANLTGPVTSVGNATAIAAGAITNAMLATISTAGKVSNAATTATNANTASAIVARDASGNFSAGTITASLTGTASGNLVSGGALGTPSSGTLTNCTFPTLNQNTTGNAATATNLSSNRTFELTGDVTGSVSSNLSGGASIATTVVDNSHSHSVSTITDVASSFFTPTAGTFTNLSAVTIGTSEFMYVRVDDKVMVWGSIDVDATATGDWAFRLSIPIARSAGFENSTSAAGTASGRNAADYSAIIQSLTASTTQVTVLGYAGTTAARTVKLHFVYDL